MERLNKSVRILLLMLPVAMVGVRFVWAHEGATGITKQRMDAMESMARAIKAIRRSLEGNRDSAAIQIEAGRIREMAVRIPEWFPPGSDAKPTDALPAVWQRWTDFRRELPSLSKRALSGDGGRIRRHQKHRRAVPRGRSNL